MRAGASAGGSYETNPFLREGEGSEGAASAYVQLDPQLEMRDERMQLSLNGSTRLRKYTRRHGEDFMARLGVNARHRSTERLSLSLNANAMTSRSAAIDIAFSAPEVPTDDEVLPEFPEIDPSDAGRRGRSSALSGSFSANYALTPVSSLNGQISANLREFSRNGSDFRSFSAGVGYSRTLSEKMSLNADVRVEDVNYRQVTAADRTIIAPRAGLNWSLNANARLQVEVGADFTNSRGVNSEPSRTSLAGSVSFCDRQLGGSLCMFAQRSARPTGSARVSTVTSAGASYSAELSPYDRVSFSARYSTQNSGDEDVATGVSDSELLAVIATYSRQIADRASVFVSPSIAKTWSRDFDRDENLQIMVGIAITIGDR